MTICKPRHWNLGIGIGIGIGTGIESDTTNAIISSSIRSMDIKPSRVVGWGDPTHKVTWHIDHVVTWQIKNAISLLSQGLWTPDLAGWWLRMREIHPRSHVTLQLRDHVTNQKYLSSLSQVSRSTNLAGWWLALEDPTQRVMCYLNHAVTWQLSSR